MDFSRWFHDRHGYPPFPWQEALAQRLARREWPDALTPPAGAGKTTLIDAWLWARLAGHPVPLRLTYIIYRRVVVDGVEDHARGLADSLPPAERPAILLLSTRLFRHEFLTFTHLATGYPRHIAAPCETGREGP